MYKDNDLWLQIQSSILIGFKREWSVQFRIREVVVAAGLSVPLVFYSHSIGSLMSAKQYNFLSNSSLTVLTPMETAGAMEDLPLTD